MDLEILTSLFTGSPEKKILQQHRKLVLDALLVLNRQILCLGTENAQTDKAGSWPNELPRQLQKLEREIIGRIKKPSLASRPSRALLADALQNQSHLALQIFRVSGILSYRPLQLPLAMLVTINELTNLFGKVVYQLRKGILELDEARHKGSLKHQASSLKDWKQSMTHQINRLTDTSQKFRDAIYSYDDIEPADIAQLSLVLDDISDLSLWMKGMVIHQQI